MTLEKEMYLTVANEAFENKIAEAVKWQVELIILALLPNVPKMHTCSDLELKLIYSRYFYSELKDATNCYTLEVSFYGYKKEKEDAYNYKVYTEESCIL